MALNRRDIFSSYTFLVGILSQGPNECGKPESSAIFTVIFYF